MKFLMPVLIGVTLLAGCGGGGNNNSATVDPPPVMPPPVTPPPVEPPPVEPPAPMQSFAAFTRTVYAEGGDTAPLELNALQFNQDAADDDFSDLLE